MRIGARVRSVVRAFLQERRHRLDKQFFLQFVPKRIPNLAQLSHIGTFLSDREKNLIASASIIALFSLGGIIFSFLGLATKPIPANGGTLNIALTDQPANINPIFAANETDRTLTRILFLPLCNFSEKKIATLAESCEINAQKTRATIALAERKWHDNEKITAADVIYTINALADKNVASPWYELARRVTVKKIDDSHLIITAARPIPALNSLLSLGIIPEHVWKTVPPQNMKNHELNLKPIGSGPFQYDSTTPEPTGGTQLMTLSYFSDFSPTRPYLDAISVRFTIDDQTTQDLFRSRQTDIITLLGYKNRDEMIKRDVKRHEIIAPIIVGLFFNPQHFSEANKLDARRAFALGIDRAALIKNVFKNEGTPLRSAFPSGVLKEPQNLEPDYAADSARPLFEKLLNGKPELNLVIGMPSDLFFSDIVAELSNQLASYHIKLSPVVVDPITNPASTEQVDLLLIGQNYGDVGDPLPFWHSSASAAGGANYGRYQIKEVDQWLEQLLGEPAGANREKLLQKINARIVTDLPAIFLVQPSLQIYVAQKFNNVIIPSTGLPETIFSGIENWYSATRRAWVFLDN